MTTYTPGPAALRAMAHPMRLRILGLLRLDGPATASGLAARLGINSGAASYHLRQLAQHGFIVDDPERGNARERWWKAAYQSTRSDRDSESTQEGREAIDAFGQAIAVVHAEQLQRSVEERALLSAPWRLATTESDWVLRLTPERAHELVQAVQAVVSGWDEDTDEETAATPYVVQVHGFPVPGSAT